MKIRRIVTAESKAGVIMQVSDVLDTDTADRVTNIWGFDKLPALPLTPEQVLGEYKRLGIFGPQGSVRVDLQVVPPEKAGATDLGSLMAKIDFGTGGGMTQGEHGGGMHRTDTIDLAVVLKGEVISATRERTAKHTQSRPRKATSSCRTAPFTNSTTARTTLA
jgi:hypothetical protein